MSIRLISDLILVVIAAGVAYKNYCQLLKKESSQIKNGVDTTFSVVSDNSCEIKKIAFLFTIDSIQNNSVGVYFDIEATGDHEILLVNTPFKISKDLKEDRKHEEITATKNSSHIIIRKKEKSRLETKISNLYLSGEIGTNREASMCKYIFQLHDFYVGESPFKKGKELSRIANGNIEKMYSPSIKKLNVLFRNTDKRYQSNPEKSLPFPNVFLSQELRWYSESEGSNHSSIYAVFSNYSKIEINRRKYFISSIIFTLASSSLVAIVLDIIWGV